MQLASSSNRLSVQESGNCPEEPDTGIIVNRSDFEATAAHHNRPPSYRTIAGTEAVCGPLHNGVERARAPAADTDDQGGIEGDSAPAADDQGVEGDVKVSCWKSERNVTMGLLLLITCFLFMDQNLMAPNLTDIARDFNMTDTERDTKLGGEISLSLFVVGAPVSVFVGYHADRLNRKMLYGIVVLIGEAGCLLTAFVSEYWQLFVLRALTGVALGGALPLVYSMVGDLYPAAERPRASSFVGLTMGLGVGAGQMLAAALGSTPLGWRAPFVVVAAPCLVVLIFFFRFAIEPKRGSQEVGYEAQQKAEMEAKERTGNGKSSLDDSREEVTLQGGHRRVRPTGLPMVVGERVTRNEDTHVGGRQVDSVDQGEEGVGKSSEDTMQATPSTPIATTPEEGHFSRLMVFVRLFRRPSNCFLFSQGIPGCMPWGVIGVFLNDYLIEDRSAPSKLGAFAVVATYGLGTVIGQLSGGYLGKRLYVWNPSYVCYLMGSCQILSIGPLLLLLNLPFEFYTLVPISILGGIFNGVPGPNIKAMVLNVNTPDTRGSAMAMFSLTDDIGKGLGPPLVGILIVRFGRQTAFSISACMWFVSGVLLLMVGRSIGADEDYVAQQVAIQQQARLAHLGIQDTDMDIVVETTETTEQKQEIGGAGAKATQTSCVTHAQTPVTRVVVL